MPPFPKTILPETAEARAELKSLLELGLPNLWDGTGIMEDPQAEYICITVYRGGQSYPLSNFVAPMIHPSWSLDGWLDRNNMAIADGPEMQAYRKAWMLKLIGELS